MEVLVVWWFYIVGNGLVQILGEVLCILQIADAIHPPAVDK